MLIDVHIHAGEVGRHYPEWWAAELYRLHGGGSGLRIPGDPDLPPGKRLLKLMDETGIDKAVLMTSDHRRVYVDREGPYTPNEWLLEVIETDRTRLFGMCSVDPLRDPYQGAQEVRRMLEEHDIRALKLYPTYDHFYPADERCWPLYRLAIEHDIPVMFHMGRCSIVNAPMKYQPPHLLDEVGMRFPELKVIVAHLAFPWVEECVTLLQRHEHFHGDIAYWDKFPSEKILRHLSDFRVLCSFEKLLYGSENAYTATFPTKIRGLNDVAEKLGFEKLSDEDMEHLTWRNAARLFKIDIT